MANALGRTLRTAAPPCTGLPVAVPVAPAERACPESTRPPQAGAREVVAASGVEATIGFEPMNRGFADLRVEPLHHVAPWRRTVPAGVCRFGCPSRIRTSANGSKVRCPTARRRGSGAGSCACDREEWSGRRDSNPRPSPWQGDALPTEPLPLDDRPGVGAESQIRTGDTAIFSRVLYQLSYLGLDPGPRGGPSARRRIARPPSERQPPGSYDAGGPGARSSAACATGSRTIAAFGTGGSPVSWRRRLMRSSAAGWVENSPLLVPLAALIGLSK